jgi:nitrous oxidase accessory protein NosD
MRHIMKDRLFLVLSLPSLLFCLSYVRLSHVVTKASGDLSVHNLNTNLNYTSIQEAINAPETLDGHTIKVDAGDYYEHIIVSKSITLVGESRDVSVIDGNGTGIVVFIADRFVTISNFTIRNAGRTWIEHPGYVESCVQGSDVANVTIQNVACIGGAVSVWFDRSSCINITDSIVSNGEYIGIGGYTLQNVTISNNVVFD